PRPGGCRPRAYVCADGPNTSRASPERSHSASRALLTVNRETVPSSEFDKVYARYNVQAWSVTAEKAFRAGHREGFDAHPTPLTAGQRSSETPADRPCPG